MNRFTNIFFLGVILMGCGLVRIIESLIRFKFPSWILVVAGASLALYSIFANPDLPRGNGL